MLIDPTISIAHNDLTDKKGFTLSALMHNEIYFLPDFLEHYRKLGVARFIILDDRSDDGSYEFAAKQPDVMILKSDHRFGDPLIDPDSGNPERALIAWRNTIQSRFCNNEWSAFLDLDEFIELPTGLTFPKLVEQINEKDGDVIWGVMIDMYPYDWKALGTSPAPSIGDLDWYFDGRSHLKIRESKAPKVLYSGVRARLKATYNIGKRPEKINRKIKRLLTRNPYPVSMNLKKPALVRWNETMKFSDVHTITNTQNIVSLLPIAHYKFTPSLHKKIATALVSKAYFDGSQEYNEIQQLYERMSNNNSPFVGKVSVKYTGYDSFEKTGNANGLTAKHP